MAIDRGSAAGGDQNEQQQGGRLAMMAGTRGVRGGAVGGVMASKELGRGRWQGPDQAGGASRRLRLSVTRTGGGGPTGLSGARGTAKLAGAEA
jgi:hypothetical protein